MALSVSVTPGKTWRNSSDPLTPGKLNATANPAVALAGTVDSNQLTNEAVTAAKLAFGATYWASASTASNVITLTASGHTLDDTSLVTGLHVAFLADATTTSTVDIKLSAGGTAKNLYRAVSTELRNGDIRSGQVVVVRYDGAQFQLVSGTAYDNLITGADAGSTDAYAITTTPAVRALADIQGLPVLFKANTVNTGACTLAIDGLAATAIKKEYDSDPATNDIQAGQWVMVVYDGTNFQMISPVTAATARATVPVRQTVLGGPVDSNGHPVILSYSGQDVTLEATTDDPTTLAFAYGFDSSGAVDYIKQYTADASSAWTIPTTDATYYLFVDRSLSDGSITFGYTTTAPTYVEDDAAAVTSGAHTFLINRMKMYLGNGTTADEKLRVFVGTAVVSSSAITSVTSYMFRGRFQSASDQTISSTSVVNKWSETHKLGIKPRTFRWVLVCQSAELDYGLADEVPVTSLKHSVSALIPGTERANATTTTFVWLGSHTMALNAASGSSYALTGITAGNWKFRAYAERGW